MSQFAYSQYRANNSLVFLDKAQAITATIKASKEQVCKGETPTPTITFSADGGTTPYTFTYTENGTRKKISTTETNNSVIISLSTNSIGTFTYSLDSVASSLQTAEAVTGKQVSIKVNALPTVDFSFLDNQCSGTAVAFNPNITGTGPFTYLWDFGDGTTSTENNPTHLFNSIGNGIKAFSVSLTVTDKSTCKTSVSKSANIKQAPDPTITSSVFSTNYKGENTFINCDATKTSPEFDFDLNNASTTISTNTNYVVDWGDGTTESFNNLFVSKTHRYTKLGFFNIKITVSNTNGCNSSAVYKFFNGNAPAGNLGTLGNDMDCVPFTFKWPVQNTSNNPPGTTYEFSVNDGSAPQLFDQTNLPDSISHTFTKTSCGNTDNQFTVTFKVTNPCDTKAPTTQIKATQKPIASFAITPNSNNCPNSIVTFTNTSIGDYYVGNNCSSTFNKTWEITPNTGWSLNQGTLKGTDIIKLLFSTPGIYSIKLKIQKPNSPSSRCTTDSITQQICIESTPIPLFSIDKTEGCYPLTVNTNNTTNESTSCTTPMTYTWAVNYTASNCGSTSGYSITNGIATSKNPIFQFTKAGTYKISLKAENACGAVTSTAQTIVVKAPPSASINTVADLCQTFPSTSINPQAVISNCGTGAFSYEWSFPGGTPSSSTSAIPGSITYNSAGTYNITLKVTNECSTTTATPISFKINPPPSITGTLSACIGSTSQLTGFGTAASTNSWVSSNTSIATVSNTGLVTAKSAGTINITYTNSNGCQTSVSFTVNATPIISGTLSACIGSTSQLSGSETAASSSPWTSSNTTIATVNNTGLVTAKSVGTTTITYTNSNGCQTSASFSVNALPTITGILSACIGSTSQLNGTSTAASTNPWVSSNTTIATVSITGLVTAKSAGTTTIIYTNSNGCQTNVSFSVNAIPSITGTLSACIGSTSQLSGSETAASSSPWTSLNTTIATVNNTGLVTAKSAGTTTITYTNSNGCQTTEKFTVNPTPKISNKTLTICSGENFLLTPTNGSGDIVPANTTYTWSAPGAQTGISGLAAGTNETIISGTLVNTNTTPKIVTYTITPVSGDIGNCPGQDFTLSVTVNPKPVSLGLTNKVYCNGTAVPILSLTNTVSGTTYTWTNSNTAIGLAASSTGNVTSIPSFTATNNTSNPITATIKLYPTFTNGGQSCTGAMEQFDITVNPAAVVLFSKGNQTKCSGEATEEVLLSSATNNVTFNWTATKPAGITGTFVNSGTNTIPAQTLENTTNTAIDIIYSATGTVAGSTNCPGAASTYIIRINPKPQINSTINTNVCSGNTFSVTPPTSGNTLPTGITYSWGSPTVTGGITGGAAGNNVAIISGTLTNPTNTTQTATYTVTPKANGCDGPTFDVMVTVYPKPVIANKSKSVCSGTNFTVDFTTPSDIIPVNTTYTWGTPSVTGTMTGGTAGNNSATISGNLTNTTNTNQTATYIVTPTSGSTGSCPGSSFTITITVKPALKATITSSAANACLNSGSPTITLTGINGTPPYTFTYKLNGGSDIDLQTTSASSTATINVPTTNVTSNTYSLVKITDASANSCSQTVSGNAGVNITEIPNITSAQNQTICSGSTFNISPVNGGANTVPTGTTYTWSAPTISPSASAITGGSAQSIAQSSIGQTLTNTTDQIATATYTVTPKSGSCDGATFQVVVTVNPSPKVIFSDADNKQTLCSGATSDAVNLSSVTTGDVAFSWTANVPTGITGTITTGNNTIPAQTLSNSTNIPLDVIYTANATLNNAGACPGRDFAYKITVNPVAKANTVSNIKLCNNEQSTIITFGSNVTGTTYKWDNDNASIGLAATGNGNLPVFTATNTGIAPIIATITVTPTANGCEGTKSTFTITINPTPTVNKPADQTVCNGFKTTDINFTGNIATTTYNWTNDKPTIGLAATGNGNITAFTAVNTGTAAITATITVTPVDGCSGTPKTFTITVNPSPAVNFSIQNQTICSGGTTNTVNLSSPSAGAVFTWTAVQPTNIEGVITSGNNTIPTQTLINKTSTPIQVKYTAYAEISGFSCTGAPKEYFITVNPTPHIVNTEKDTICSGTSFNIIPLDGLPNIVPTGTTYTWSAPIISPSASAITGGSAQSIAQSSIGQTLTNTTDQIATATYTVTPKSGSCDGATFQVVVTVNPSPKVIFSDADNKQTLCSGATSDAVNLSSVTTGDVAFSWTANVPTGITGTITTGNNTIPAQTLSNSTNIPLDVIYTANATLNNAGACPGRDFAYKITVNPVAKANTVSNIKLCNNEQSTIITFGSNVTGTTYKWDNDNASIGLAATGNGNLPVFTATNTGIAPIIATITVTPTANGCEGTKSTFTITINPTPTVNKPADQTVCNGFKTTDINFTGNIATTTYNWTNDKPTIGLAATGNGNITAFTAVNTGTAAITATITVTPVDGCSGTPKTFTITVNPSPAFTQHPQSEAVCVNGAAKTLSVSYKNGTGIPKYEWYSNTVKDSISGALIPYETTANYIPSSNTVGVMYYYCVLTLPSAGCGSITSNIATVTVNPLPTISTEPFVSQRICVGGVIAPLAVAYTGGTGTATYQWYSNSSDSNTGGTQIIGATSANYTPPVFNAAGTYYFYCIVSLNGNGCGSATSQTAKVEVVADPVVTAPLNSQTVCQSTAPATLSVTASEGEGAYSYQWYSNSIKSNAGGTLINFENNTSYIPPTDIVGTKYYYCSVNQTGLGCATFSDVAEVNIVPAPQFSKQPESSSICINGAAKTLSVAFTNGTGTPSYQWYSNATNNNTGGTAITTAPNSSFDPPTNVVGTTYYYCVISLTGGGCSSITSNAANVTVNPLPTISTEPFASQRICVGGVIAPLTVAYTGGTGTPNYQWYSNSTNSNTGGTAISGAKAASFTPAAFNSVGKFYFYCVVNLDGNGCGITTSLPAEVEVVPDPVVTAPLATQTVCQSTAPATLSVTASGGEGTYSYQWYSNTSNSNAGGSLINSANNASYIPPTDIVDTKYYYCSVTQTGLGCATISAVAEVIVKLAPTIVTQPQSSTVCKGETPTELSVSYKDGAGSPLYQWYSNTTDDRTTGTAIPDATKNIYNPSGATVGTVYYYCIITLPTGGCSSLTSNSAKVTVNQYPVISDFTRLIGSGTSFTVQPLSVSGKDIVPVGTLYTWSMPEIFPVNSISGASAQSNPQTLISQTLTNNTKAIATVTYTAHPVSGICAGADFKITVTVNPPISPNTVITDISCFNANNGNISTNIQGGIPPYSITWLGPNGFSSTDSSISDLKPGDYILKITDNGGLPFTEIYTVNEPKEITLTTVKEKDIDCNGAANGEISIFVTGGKGSYFYTWTKNNIAFDTTQNIKNLEPGEYKVSVTDMNNCGPKTQTYTITEPEPLKIILANKIDNLCIGDKNGSLSVVTSGGTKIETKPGVFDYNYLWTGPKGFTATTKNISGLYSGTYILSVSDASGCSTQFSTQVTEPDSIKVQITSTSITCYGADDASITLDVSGGVAPYTAEWDNFSTGFYQPNLSAKDYNITITDANHCVKTIKVTIPEAPVFRITPVVKQISCHGANDGSIKLNMEGGQGKVKLAWNDGSTSGNERNNIGPGSYTVTITDDKPCSIVRTFIIQEPLELSVTGKITDAHDCSEVNSGAIDLEISGGTEPYSINWSNSATTEDLTQLAPGNYYVQVTDARGCVKQEQFVVSRQLPLSINVEKSYEYDCAQQKITQLCKANVSGGVPPYNISWSSGNVDMNDNTLMRTGQTATVILKVTDALNCDKSVSFNTEIPHTGISYSVLDCNSHSYQFHLDYPDILFTNVRFEWNFGDGATSAIRNPQHTYIKQGTYDIKVKLLSNECNTTYNYRFFADSIPVLRLDKPAKLCKNDSVILHITGADFYNWSDGTSADSIIIRTAGDYSVTGTTRNGCTASMSFTASYYDYFNYSIQSDKDQITPEDATVEFWSADIPLSKYYWNFGDGKTDAGNFIYHNYTVDRGGYMEVELTATNPYGCTEKATKKIWLSMNKLPNIFTPNGDGYNDVFLKGWNLQVFNSNGVLLYEGLNGWDGTYKGTPVSTDTYYYVVIVYNAEGSSSKADFVTVVR